MESLPFVISFPKESHKGVKNPRTICDLMKYKRKENVPWTIQLFFIVQSWLLWAPMISVSELGPGHVVGLSARKSVAVSATRVKLSCVSNQAICFHWHYCCWLPKTEDALSLDTENLAPPSPRALSPCCEGTGSCHVRLQFFSQQIFSFALHGVPELLWLEKPQVQDGKCICLTAAVGIELTVPWNETPWQQPLLVVLCCTDVRSCWILVVESSGLQWGGPASGVQGSQVRHGKTMLEFLSVTV